MHLLLRTDKIFYDSLAWSVALPSLMGAYQRLCTVRPSRPAPTCGESFVGRFITHQIKRWLVDANLFQHRHRQTQWIWKQWVISVSLFGFVDDIFALFSPLSSDSFLCIHSSPYQVTSCHFHFLRLSPLHSCYRPSSRQLHPWHPSPNHLLFYV